MRKKYGDDYVEQKKAEERAANAQADNDGEDKFAKLRAMYANTAVPDAEEGAGEAAAGEAEQGYYDEAGNYVYYDAAAYSEYDQGGGAEGDYSHLGYYDEHGTFVYYEGGEHTADGGGGYYDENGEWVYT